MELSTVALILPAFYRLVGSESGDAALTANGEGDDDVALQFLTLGVHEAQRWMLKCGYDGWRTRSSALAFTGSDDTAGGRKATLPTNFLRAYGDEKKSALREANGDPWGQEVNADDELLHGDSFYFRGETELWLGRGASPPATLYLEYHYKHPTITAIVTLDFPMDARWLIVAEAANAAKEENWLPGGKELELKIERALQRARERARDQSRPSKQIRRMRPSVRHGSNW